MKEKFSIKRRILSFKYAFNGFRILIAEEHNARIHVVASIIAVCLSFLLRISLIEWFFICFAIGFVIAMETINTALENLSDMVCPQTDERVKKIKDIAAFAVLLSALISAIVGSIIFIPKIIAFFSE